MPALHFILDKNRENALSGSSQVTASAYPICFSNEDAKRILSILQTPAEIIIKVDLNQRIVGYRFVGLYNSLPSVSN